MPNTSMKSLSVHLPMSKSVGASVGIFVILALCIAANLNGLFGSFMFDDYPNIVNNNLLAGLDGTGYHWWLAALSSDSGILRRPLSMLSFAANIYFNGMDPVAFKVVNLLIHLVNGALIYRLSVCLIPYLRPSLAGSQTATQDQALALFVTALWLLHPLNVSSVVYVVQRMNLLATVFILAGLYCYVEGRRRILKGEHGMGIAFSGLIAFGLLATFSKENGALIVLYAFVIEAVCFRFRGAPPLLQKPVVVFFVLTLALPLALLAGMLLIYPGWLTNGYEARAFTLTQRLLTEPRIITHYLQWIFLPLPSSMGLYHDDIPISSDLFAPVTTFTAIAALCVLVTLAWKARLRMPAFTFGVAWFLAGHSMESTILPLEIVFEHRNYLPMAGLLMGTVVAVSHVRLPRPPTAIVCIGGVVLVLTFAGLTFNRSSDWGDPIRLALVTAEDHPSSPRSLYDAGRATIIAAEAEERLDDEARTHARSYFVRAMALDNTYVFPAISAILTGFHGKTVPESAVADLEYRLRNMPLFQATPLLMLLTRIGDGAVIVAPDDVERLVTASLDNPSAGPGARAMILNNYGRYLFVVRHDAQSAISLTLAAAEMAPGNPFFQVNLVRLALALGQPDIALAHLENAKAWDITGIYAKDIDALRIEIAEQKRS